MREEGFLKKVATNASTTHQCQHQKLNARRNELTNMMDGGCIPTENEDVLFGGACRGGGGSIWVARAGQRLSTQSL